MNLNQRTGILKETSSFWRILNLLQLIIFFILITAWINPAFANIVKQAIEKPVLVPAVLLEWNGGFDYAVLVDKSQQKVMLYHHDDLTAPKKTYPCSTGENDGPKSKKNDQKTPEGIYYFTDSVPDRYLSPIYGVRALPIDYPNVVDKKEERGGYGIWFHGTNKPLQPNDSNGCIVLANNDIEELAKFVKLHGTPIIISSKIEMVPPEDLEKDRKELADIIEDWRSSWQGKNIEKYMSLYNSKFTDGWKDWSQYKEYKARLAEKYEEINVEIDDLSLLMTNGVVVATFKQHYSTPIFESYGTKKLYITKNSEEWKIISESFKGDESQKTAPTKTVAYPLKEVEDFIYSWKNAWEKEDLTSYISCYDKDFQSRDMDLNEWKNHRDRLNKKYGSIEIRIEDLEINRPSDNSASVSFKQYYQADDYSDVGEKELELIKKGKDWKIKEEMWTPLKK